MIIQINNVSKIVGGELLFDDIQISIKEGEKIGLIGSNGCGKSTLLRIIAGLESCDGGKVSIQNGKSLGYLRQERITGIACTCQEYLIDAKPELQYLAKRMKELEEKLACAEENNLEKALEQYGEAQIIFEEQGGYLLESQIQSITHGLGIADLLEHNIKDLSGGEQTLLSLAKILLEDPDVLLLDEPTNHLDFTGLAWLENYLLKSKKTFLIVSHDRIFLNNVVSKIVELDFETKEYYGNYSKYKEQKKKQQEELLKDYEQQQKEIKKTKEAIRRYRQWGHEGDNEKFFKRAKQLEKRLAQMEEIRRPKKERVAMLKEFTFSQRSGKEVLQVKHMNKKIGNRELLKDISFTVYWQDRVGIIGNNGCGKSTLLKIMLGQEQGDSGEIKMGHQVELGYLSQHIVYEHPKATVLDEFRRETDSHEEESRRILAKYLFFKEDVFRTVENLSGGEKVRLELAKLMQQSINLLVLDEPTNHLDIETRELLESVLKQFQGTLIVVTHDRYLLQEVVSKRLLIQNERIIDQ